ncbi:hypothetical protein ABZS77_23940 [Micromonospora sp. NPDC005298]|uniref:hypothetical protein n=1 Tax=Micromonospora sp. NPDC005298 TaxID=3156873 RepID=UPI0033AD1F11
MASNDDASVVDFHSSPARRRKALAVVTVLAAGLLVTYAAIVDEPWWHALLRFGGIGLASAAVIRWQLRRQPRLPLRLTAESLRLTGPDGTALTIDWTNVASAQVRGAVDPRLVVRPRDPGETRPPMRPNQWSTPGRGPYELVVQLTWMIPDRHALRRELARRLPAT